MYFPILNIVVIFFLKGQRIVRYCGPIWSVVSQHNMKGTNGIVSKQHKTKLTSNCSKDVDMIH